MRPGPLALACVLTGFAAGIAAAFWPAAREPLVVAAIFFVLLAGGVLNWRRGGH